MAKKRKPFRSLSLNSLFHVVLLCCMISALSMVLLSLHGPVPNAKVLSATTSREETVTLPVVSVANQDGNRRTILQSTDTYTWIGTMSGPNTSYLGLLFDHSALPTGSTITSAKLQVTAYVGSRVPLKMEVRGLLDASASAFPLITDIPMLVQSSTKKDLYLTTAWSQGQRYIIDVTGVPSVTNGLLFRGTGSRYSFRNISLTEETAPKLIVKYLAPIAASNAVTGDCNGDGIINAGDYSALALEIGDQDGDSLQTVAQGSFKGTEQCDANYDAKINAIDYTCMRRKIFENPTACDEFAAPASIPGDCNGDAKVDAGDLSALSLEFSDLDGTTRERVHNSTYKGFQGCDANSDGFVTSADRTCISNLMFGKTCN